MQGLIHCKIQSPQLASELGKALPALEVERLYRCVKTGPLRYRKRAFALLCYEKGIKTALIRRFLAAGPDYVDRIVRQYLNPAHLEEKFLENGRNMNFSSKDFAAVDPFSCKRLQASSGFNF